MPSIICVAGAMRVSRYLTTSEIALAWWSCLAHRRNLRKWMHWLLVSYTVYFNRRHHSSGHLFQGRYKSFLVQEGDHLLGLSRYVHLNPVRGASLGRVT